MVEYPVIRSKPKFLDFRVEGKSLFGKDNSDGTEYRITFCGNGPYSHYTLSDTVDSDKSWYVYVDDKDYLYRSIYDAEMRMIFKALPCALCHKNYVKPEYATCHNCGNILYRMFA